MLRDIANAIVRRVGERLQATRPEQGLIRVEDDSFEVHFLDGACVIKREVDILRDSLPIRI